MKNKTLEQLFKELTRDWLAYKKEAIKTGDFKQYNQHLIIIQSEFGKLYAEVTKPELVALVEQVLKTASCELKENNIKYNKQYESR